jgi:hypothetical protein
MFRIVGQDESGHKTPVVPLATPVNTAKLRRITQTASSQNNIPDLMREPVSGVCVPLHGGASTPDDRPSWTSEDESHVFSRGGDY